MKIYEPVHVACDVCNERETYCFPFCRVPGEAKPRFIGVCKECRESLEYEVIPINTMLGEGSPDVLYSMTYFVKNGPHGIIAPGQSVKLEQDMHFSAYHTGNA